MTPRARPGGIRRPERATACLQKPIRSPAKTHDADAAMVPIRTSEDARCTAASKVVDKLRNCEPRRAALAKQTRGCPDCMPRAHNAFGPTRWTARFIG